MYQYKTLGNTVYFPAVITNTSGGVFDGGAITVHVRRVGASIDAAPIYSTSAHILSHANWPAGHVEIQVSATSTNGFSAESEYAVFIVATVSGNQLGAPAGMFVLSPLLTSANVQTIVEAAIDNKDIPGSASISAMIDGALTNYDVPTSAAMSADQALLSAQIAGISATIAGVSAALSTHAAQALSDFAPLVSANLSAGLEAAVFKRALTEPVGAPSWASPNFDTMIEWVVARSLNRIHQASTSTAIYSSAGSLVASCSIAFTSSSSNIDQWL